MSTISTLTAPLPKQSEQSESYTNLFPIESSPRWIAHAEFVQRSSVSFGWPEAEQGLLSKLPRYSSIAIEVEDILKSLRDSGVQFRGIDAIRQYLLSAPRLIDVITKAVLAANRYFPGAQLVMSIYEDPEIEDRYVIIYVRLKQYDDSVVDRLEKAEAEFLEDLADREGWVQLTTDFRESEEEDVL